MTEAYTGRKYCPSCASNHAGEIVNHPADELFAEVVIKIANYRACGENPFPEIKQRMQKLYDMAFESGQEDERNADKGLGGTR